MSLHLTDPSQFPPPSPSFLVSYQTSKGSNDSLESTIRQRSLSLPGQSQKQASPRTWTPRIAKKKGPSSLSDEVDRWCKEEKIFSQSIVAILQEQTHQVAMEIIFEGAPSSVKVNEVMKRLVKILEPLVKKLSMAESRIQGINEFEEKVKATLIVYRAYCGESLSKFSEEYENLYQSRFPPLEIPHVADVVDQLILGGGARDELICFFQGLEEKVKQKFYLEKFSNRPFYLSKELMEAPKKNVINSLVRGTTGFRHMTINKREIDYVDTQRRSSGEFRTLIMKKIYSGLYSETDAQKKIEKGLKDDQVPLVLRYCAFGIWATLIEQVIERVPELKNCFFRTVNDLDIDITFSSEEIFCLKQERTISFYRVEATGEKSTEIEFCLSCEISLGSTDQGVKIFLKDFKLYDGNENLLQEISNRFRKIGLS